MADANEQMLTEARRRLDSQVKRLDELRSRSVALLGFAAVAAGLFGVLSASPDHSVRRHHRRGAETAAILTVHGGLLVAAFGAFLVIVVLTALINRPVKGWDDGEKLDRWLDWAHAQDAIMRDFEINLALALNEARTANADAVGERAGQIRWVCYALAVEVFCGALAVLV